jgi:hypothetical protein
MLKRKHQNLYKEFQNHRTRINLNKGARKEFTQCMMEYMKKDTKAELSDNEEPMDGNMSDVS